MEAIKKKGNGYIISGLGVKYVQVPDGRYVMECDLSLHNYLEDHPMYYQKLVDGKLVATNERECLADYCYIGKKRVG